MLVQQPEFGLSRGFDRLGLALVLVSLFASATVALAQSQPQTDGGPCVATIPEIYDRVSPAVVSITSMAINASQPADRVNRAVGSGVIIDTSGLVLTIDFRISNAI